MIQTLKKRFAFLRGLKCLGQTWLGLLLYTADVIRSGFDVYKAGGKFYARIQSDPDSLAKKMALRLLESPLGALIKDYYFWQANKDRNRPSTGVLQSYSDEALMGYGSLTYDKGGASLETQQRGILLPPLDRSLSEGSGDGLRQVVEIGCGNGDVLAHLALRYPALAFKGVDFFVANAKAKHGRLPNLTFQQGYALDLLRQGQLQGDLLYASSTFCCFTPLEIADYFRTLRRCGFSQIVLSEPVWYGWVQKNNEEAFSRHLSGSVWFHNYAGYLRAAGFTPSEFHFFPYTHPKSARPDLFLIVLKATAPVQDGAKVPA